MRKLKEKIAELIDTEKEVILDQYFCKLNASFKSERHMRPIPDQLLVLLRARFRDVLERQISFLRNGQYDNSASSEDKSYAMQVIPFCSQDLKSRRMIRTMELFIASVTEHIFNKLGEINSISYASIVPLLDKLVYLAYEDLWITTIVSHGLQRKLIQKLLKETIKAHEDERRELAIVLHDSVLQSLATALIHVQIAEKLIKEKNHNRRLTQELLHLQKVITDTVQKIRNLNYELSPLCLREQGLIATLHGYMADFQRDNGISAHLVLPDSIDETLWGKDTQANIYRMIQELLTNIKKHANADRMRIEISTEDECLHLSVEDNGIGFDLSQVLANMTRSTSFGLLSISEQTRGYNGVMRIDTSPGQGTRIKIEVPSDD